MARRLPDAAVGLTVWYDGDCPLCRREIGLMKRLDRAGAIAFIDLALGGPCPVDRASLMARLHAQETGSPLVHGAAAFAAMWRRIPALRPLGRLAQWPPALWFLEQAYIAFLKVRPTLQGLARALERGDVGSGRHRG